MDRIEDTIFGFDRENILWLKDMKEMRVNPIISIETNYPTGVLNRYSFFMSRLTGTE